MADIEKRVDKLERGNSNLEKQVSNISTKVDAFVQEVRDFKTEMRNEMRDFKQEMRQQNEMRQAEIIELRKKQDAAQAKHDAEMKELNERIDSKFDKLSSQIQNMAIAAVVGVGAIVWAVVSALR